jgi:hypothetical protein
MYLQYIAWGFLGVQLKRQTEMTILLGQELNILHHHEPLPYTDATPGLATQRDNHTNIYKL